MTITTKAKLVDNVYKWLIRDQLTDTFITQDLIATYVQLCESEGNRELKIIDLVESVSVSTAGSDNFINLPEGFRGIQSLEFDDRPFKIEWFPTRQEMKEKYGNTPGRPQGYTVIGTKIVFPGVAQGVHSMTLDYYKNISPLTDDNTTNVILQKFPDFYLYGTIRQALINLNIQNRLENVATIYKDIIDRILEDDKNARMPVGATMKPRTVIGG